MYLIYVPCNELKVLCRLCTPISAEKNSGSLETGMVLKELRLIHAYIYNEVGDVREHLASFSKTSSSIIIDSQK